ncbi:hypothetical protein JNO13_16785 [Pseudomonas sp. 1079]|nr:hypothetical protein [Pseudomonas sp. 1079]
MGEAGNVAMATGFNWVGDYVTFPNSSPQKIIAHALMGGDCWLKPQVAISKPGLPLPG